MYNSAYDLNQDFAFSPTHPTQGPPPQTPERPGETTSAFLHRRLILGTLDLMSWGLFKYLEEQGGVFDGTLERLSVLVGQTHAEVKRSMDKLKKAGAVMSVRVGRLYHWCVVGASKAQKSPSMPLLTSEKPIPFVEPEKSPKEAADPSVGQALQSLPTVEQAPEQPTHPREPQQVARALPSHEESEGASDTSTEAPKTKLPQQREDSTKKTPHQARKDSSSKTESLEREPKPRDARAEGTPGVEDLVKEQVHREAWRAFWKERSQYPERIKHARVAAQWAEVERTYHPRDLHPSFVEALDTNLDKLDYPIVFLLSKAIQDGKSEDWSLLPREASEAFKPYKSQHASHQVFDTKALEVREEERVQGKLGLLAQLNETLQQQARHRARWNGFLAELYEGCADAPERRGKEPLEATIQVWEGVLPGVAKWMRELEEIDLDELTSQVWERLREKTTALERLEVLGQFFHREEGRLVLKPEVRKSQQAMA